MWAGALDTARRLVEAERGLSDGADGEVRRAGWPPTTRRTGPPPDPPPRRRPECAAGTDVGARPASLPRPRPQHQPHKGRRWPHL